MLATHSFRRHTCFAAADAPRALALISLIALAGCIPPRRAEHAQEPPEPVIATPGGTGPVTVIDPPPSAPSPPSMGVPKAGSSRQPVQAYVQPPRAIERRNPEYPPELIEAGLSGRLIASFTVDREGGVSDIEIRNAPHPLFEQAVRAVLPGWRFAPARDADGQPVNAKVRMSFSFRLED